MTHLNTKAQLGSISSGTLRPADLIEAFASELDYLTIGVADRTKAESKLLVEADEWLTLEEPNDDDLASEIISDLIDALQDHAPPYCYFGTHQDDGADFGFWPVMEAIEELPRCANGDKAKALGEDCLPNSKANTCLIIDALAQICRVWDAGGQVSPHMIAAAHTALAKAGLDWRA